MRKNILLTALLIFCAQSAFAKACVFDKVDIEYNEDGTHDIDVISKVRTAYPAILFEAFIQHIGKFDPKICEKAIYKKKFKVKITGEMFTAFYTSEDECDGGNAMGVIVVGDLPDKEKAIAYIDDSAAYCLP